MQRVVSFYIGQFHIFTLPFFQPFLLCFALVSFIVIVVIGPFVRLVVFLTPFTNNPSLATYVFKHPPTLTIQITVKVHRIE